MDESGGRGRPRSDNDESAERHAGPADRAAEPTPADEHPTDERPFTPEQPTPGPGPTRPATPADTPATPADAMRDESAADRPTRSDETPTGPVEPGASRPPAGDSPGRATAEDPHTTPAGPDPDVPRTAPAPADRGDGDTPEGDTHPDRAYASGPHSAPVAGRPETDRLHKAHTPAPASDDQNRAQQPPAPGDRHLAHSADGKGPAPQRPEPRGGLLMGRPFGVPVYVAPSWFLVAALITWVFGGQLERVLPELGAARYLVSLFFAVAFYASVLVHELAHTVAALRFKLPVRRIQLQFFGGVSEIEKEAETPGREFVLAFVGPLLSLVLAGIFYAAVQTVEPGTVPGVLLAGLMISNLIVAAFNLLPGLPLDGGRMLRAVVWKITGKPMKGTIAAAWVGRVLAISVLIGLPLLTQSGALGTDAVDNVGMDTVLDALLAAILAAIIWTGAGNSLRMARLREHLPELRARALTRRAVPVESDTPLSEALRRANAAGARALVVVDPDGKPLSLVREAAIVGVPEHRRPWVAVSGLAQDLTDGMRVSAELSGEELLDALRATPATEYLVVEETGEIYGVLSAADVERAFVKAMARPS
ncbi:site-2 protease family protein [Streptomyces luteogriseus]|uniref:Zn-dependent protease/CBS domain-containing protein n=1 Tax=Streptomyces luteogriseus TaxID=68233 RepID=A0A7W7GKD1_9ACTN|nr:site-2 protease family protein [Streptomyces luteogriseus]MBB4716344.1 Zn-dependent protease/CBS domain-containing protein [Streptomyces luteogriseus]